MVPWPPKELSLIGQGLSEFRVRSSDHQSTELINLHGNSLQVIPDFTKLTHLRELDLSSNRIETMNGLENLSSLQTLNLSCNFLKKVEGMISLKSLLKINLSHNQIEDLSGFMEMKGPDYALTIINLCDNRLTSMPHVVSCLRDSTNLRYLSLCRDGLTNPVCEMVDYRVRLLSRLNQLFVLDGISRDGQKVNVSGLQDFDMNSPRFFLDLIINNDIPNAVVGRNGQILSNSKFTKNEPGTSIIPNTNAKSEQSVHEINTPRIDHIIKKYREENLLDYSVDSKSDKNFGVEFSMSSDFERNTLTENQSEIVGLSLDSGSFTSPKSSAYNKPKSNPEKRDSSIQSKRTKTPNSSSPVSKKNVTQKTNKISNTKISQHKIVCSHPSQINSSSESMKDSKKKTNSKTILQDQTDSEYRNVIESTYNDLIEELNKERSERLKAELALKELSTFVNEIQEKAHRQEVDYEKTFHENVVLKENLTREKEMVKKLEGDLRLVTQDNADTGNQLKVTEKSLQNQKLLLENMQKSAKGSEREYLRELAEEQKKIKKYQLFAASAAKEAQESKSMTSFLQKQVKELEQLLTSRELEHKEELKGQYALGSKELKLIIEDKVQDVKKQHEERLKLQNEREGMMRKHYDELTMELNYALQLESGQVTKLEAAYDSTFKENELNKQALMALRAKEKKTMETVSQLTNVIKKQKEQITDLLKSKQNLTESHEQEIRKMQGQVNEAKKNVNNFSKLKQDRLKFEAQIEAQESLIVGLRAERKVWENELAQQGTMLAQDRGKLEAKIETLTTEVEYLKKQLKNEVDDIKIKSKVIADQTDSIKNLKTELSQKEKQIQEIQEDAAKSRKKIEDELALEEDALQESQLTIQRLQDRKAELKDEISHLEMELRESKNAHNVLKDQWKRKADLISSLEAQVKQAKSGWEKKEKNLKTECEKARQEVKLSKEKLKKADDAFRKQIAEKEKGQQTVIGQLRKDHQLELDIASQKILDLEEEMREILKDSSHMQEKMAKLADYFGNIMSINSQ